MRAHDDARSIYTGFHFIESPRWHEGQFWFTDMHDRSVYRAMLGEAPERVFQIEDDLPSGLGWLPDGRLLFVAMQSRQVRRLEPDGRIVVHADLSALARGDCNDMVSAADGTVWVGDMAYDTHGDHAAFEPGRTIRVSPDGDVVTAADELLAPNGHVLSADGKKLIVAESGAFRLTAFDVAKDGTLAHRRVYAGLTPEPGVDFAPARRNLPRRRGRRLDRRPDRSALSSGSRRRRGHRRRSAARRRMRDRVRARWCGSPHALHGRVPGVARISPPVGWQRAGRCPRGRCAWRGPTLGARTPTAERVPCIRCRRPGSGGAPRGASRRDGKRGLP